MKIKAHPTLGHDGLRYRSQLEARYAALFHHLNWMYQYEVFPLNGYLVDFMIHLQWKGLSSSSSYSSWILFEIKPELDFHCLLLPYYKNKIEKSGYKGDNYVICGARLFTLSELDPFHIQKGSPEDRVVIGCTKEGYACCIEPHLGSVSHIQSLWNKIQNSFQWKRKRGKRKHR